MVTATEPQLITYDEALARLGFSKRTLFNQIKDERITVYVDGINRRRRLLDIRDINKLAEVKPRPERVA